MNVPAESARHTEVVDVVIVGAGPTGLTAAIRFAQLGVPHVVLDASATPTTGCSS